MITHFEYKGYEDMNSFEKYPEGEIDLDSFIKEADRRLDTYLKE